MTWGASRWLGMVGWLQVSSPAIRRAGCFAATLGGRIAEIDVEPVAGVGRARAHPDIQDIVVHRCGGEILVVGELAGIVEAAECDRLAVALGLIGIDRIPGVRRDVP